MPAKGDTGNENDLIFCSREATNDSFLAKITSRPILADFRLLRPTGRASFVNQLLLNE